MSENGREVMDLEEDNVVNMGRNVEREAAEKVGALLEIDMLKREIEVLKREKQLAERERLATHSRDLFESVHSIGIADNASSREEQTSFRIGINEARTIIEEFNPSNKSLTAKNWLESLEGLKNVYGWDDRVTLFYATLRLGGAAYYWYQSKQDCIKTFDKFKEELLRSFPSGEDDASILIKIMERKRIPGEPIENYVYQVASLAKRINLNETSTIRYLISGLLDQNLVNVLLASQCTNIADLLRQIKNYEEIQKQGQSRRNLTEKKYDGTRQSSYERKLHTYRNVPGPSRRGENRDVRTRQESNRQKIEKASGVGRIQCFKCNEYGHYARDCPSLNKTRKCFVCFQTGHLAKDCKVRNISSVREIDDALKQNPKDEYHQLVNVEGKPILAVFDLGSECTTLQKQFLSKYSWVLENSDNILRGFGGQLTKVLGSVRKEICVSGINIITDIMIVEDKAQDVPMIIGKNFLDRPDIEVIKRWGIFEIKRVEKNAQIVNNIQSSIKTQSKIGNSDVSFEDGTKQEHRVMLMRLINDFRDCFARDMSELGKTELESMRIKLKENKIIRYHPYKVAYGLKSILREKIEELLKLDIIQPSTSEYASPVILVPKKNGEQRMCVDFRKLNAITQREIFPVPNIEETLNSLANKKIFTSLDLLTGYHQVPVEPESRHLTAFVTPEGHSEYKRVPFGLTNAPAVFVRMMAKLVQPLGPNKVITFMDDILIASSTEEENLETLKDFLIELRKAGLTLNLKKCEFFQKSIKFLGHEVAEDGIKPGMQKTIAIENYKKPETKREVKQFLGLTGYFRRFVQGFSQIALPLNKLLRKNEEFIWNEEQEQAFDNLKRILATRPVLALYDVSAQHEVHTDASCHGIAGILMQDQNGTVRPVSYFSRATTAPESKYHSYELEALAVVETLERFKHYLLHKKFKVITDCNSLRLTQEKKDLIPRIARWWLKIAEFDFELVFRPGNRLMHVDALSRCPGEPGKEAEDVTSKMLIVGVSTEDWVSVLQMQDPRLMEIKKVLNEEINHVDKNGIKGNYALENNRVYKKTAEGLRFVVPSGIRWRIIKSSHDDMGHPGVERTMQTLRKHYWFPNMKTVTTKYINSCVDCLYNKRGENEGRYQLHAPERTPIPFHTVHIDHLGPFPKSKGGNMFIIGVIDAFTKFIILKPTKTTAARTVIRLLEDITQYFGMPARIITDRGAAFTSLQFKNFCKQNVINNVLTTVKTPRSNGQIERYFRTAKTAIATMAQDPNGRDWDKNVRAIQWALNSLKNSTTKATPQELLMSYQPRNILKNKLLLAIQEDEEGEEDEEDNITLAELRQKVLQRIKDKQQVQVETYNAKHRSPRQYKKGDLVLIKQDAPATGEPRKIQPRYKGPYIIKSVLGKDRYIVCDTEELQITQKPYESVHSSERLRPWCELDQMDFDMSSSDEEEE